jgi:hypothetical protein
VNTLLSLISPLLEFVRSNFKNILIALGVILVSYLGFLATTSSLKKLNVDIFSYYPFDQFFPQSGKWSVLYFLIVILILGLLIFFLGKGGFFLTPA